MMKLSLQPVLSETDKRVLTRWLIITLGNEKLSNGENFPLSGKLTLFIAEDSESTKIVKHGYWSRESYSHNLTLARETELVSLGDRLPVLCALAQYCDDSAELRDAMQKAITRYLLGEYQALSSGLVNAPIQPRGIAFSTTGGVASLFDSGWMLPSGESVDVSGEDWVVCASELPVSEPVVELAWPHVGDHIVYLSSFSGMSEDEMVLVTAVIGGVVHFQFDDHSTSQAPVEHFCATTEWHVDDRCVWI